MRGLQDQVIPLHMGKGVDTKTDSKLVPPGKLLKLQDAVFTQADQVNKRNGYTALPTAIQGGGNLVSPQLTKTFDGELICVDRGVLYGYTENQSVWVPKGSAVSTSVTSAEVSSGNQQQLLQTSLLWNNYIFYAWSTPSNNSVASGDPVHYIAVEDITSGSFPVTNRAIHAGFSSDLFFSQKLVTLGSGAGTPALVYAGPGLLNLIVAPLTMSSSGLSIGSFPIHTNPPTMTQAAYNNGHVYLFDVANTSTGGVAIFGTNTPNVQVVSFSTGGTILNTATIALGAEVTGVTISVDPSTGNVWAYWADSTFALYYTVLSSSLSTILGPTSIGQNATQCAPYVSSSTSQRLFYSTGTLTDTSGAVNGSVSYVDVSITGVISSTTSLINPSDLYSRPFQYSGLSDPVVATIFRSIGGSVPVTNPQTTIHLINASGNYAGLGTAKIFAGEAYRNIVPMGFLPSPIQLSSSKYGFFFPQVIQSVVLANGTTELTQSSLVTVDFNSPDAYQALVANNTLVLNGGQVQGYDGTGTFELGFSLGPEVRTLVPSSSGGSLATGTYSWAFIYIWTDAKGNIYYSSPSFVSATFGSGATNSVTGTVILPPFFRPNTGLTALEYVQIAQYRTQLNGSTYTLESLSQAAPGASVNWGSNLPDSNIAANNAFYGNGGVLDNESPPPALAMALHNNRLWVVDSTNPNTVWYSKSFVPSLGIGFSGNLTAQIDAVGGSVVAIAHMDSNLVIFEQNQPLVLAGDGAGDTGQGSTLSTPQPIPSDTGCSQSKGVITFPGGVLFKSPKGIYLLDRSLSTKYIGMEVEAYNSQTITATTILNSVSQIRFLTSSGLTLVYDYIFNQWATFTNHQGYSADIWQGNYVYARTDGVIYEETPNYYLDNTTPYGVQIQTAWLALANVQGFERIKRFLTLGNYANGSSNLHGIQSSMAYDFISTFTATNPYYLSNSSSSSVYEYKTFTPRQKCAAMSILIQELVTGDSAEYVTFTDMSLLAGIKRGINKVRAGNSVG